MKKLFFSVIVLMCFSLSGFANERATENSQQTSNATDVIVKEVAPDGCTTHYVMEVSTTGSGLNTRTVYRFYPLTICVDRILA